MIDRWIAEATECDFKVALEVKKAGNLAKMRHALQIVSEVLSPCGGDTRRIGWPDGRTV